MLVPFLKLLKERMTSWLSASTAAFHVPEKPRASWVTRAGGGGQEVKTPPKGCWEGEEVPKCLCPPPHFTLLAAQPLQLPLLQQRLGLLDEGDHAAEGGGQQLLDELLGGGDTQG